MNFNQLKEKLHTYKERKTLIIPSPPTPNGELHLGHLAGPYLRADLYKRFLNIRSANVKMIFGVDSYDLYISAEAKKINTTEEEIVNMYYNEIVNDLNLANINYDYFINSMDYFDELISISKQFYNELYNKGKLIVSKKEVSYWDDTNERVLPPVISSNCPNCNELMYGNSCESCAGVFNIYDLKNCTSNNKKLHNYSDNFIEISYKEKNILNILKTNQPLLKKIVLNYLKNNSNANINVTHHFHWGVPLGIYGKNLKLVTYSNRFIFNYLYAEIYKKDEKITINPYHKNSKVEIASFFGKDNIISNIYFKNAFVNQFSDFRIENAFIANDFYLLHNKKFSTSRNHKITLKELLEKYDFSIDEIRYFLTHTSPSNAETNFTVEDLQEISKKNIAPLYHAVEHSIAVLNDTKTELGFISDKLISDFTALFFEQEKIFETANFIPEQNSGIINKWIEVKRNLQGKSQYSFWLKGLLLLIYPIMPTYSENLWNINFKAKISYENLLKDLESLTIKSKSA